MNIHDLIQMAIKEDIPNGDLTTQLLHSTPKQGRANLLAKEDIVVSGLELFEESLKAFGDKISFEWFFREGDLALRGQSICLLTGDLISILSLERIALNFIGHLSGVATLTRCFVNEIKDTQCQILDTRKTIAGYRHFEKLAVCHGLGKNHRMNLSEAILIKDNHIRLVGGITTAIQQIKKKSHLPIEIEVTNLEETKEAVEAGAQRILLDNMDLNTLKLALEIIPQKLQTEASGNMSLENIKAVANLGVQFISVGAITHSAPCADLSILFDWDSTK